MSGDDNVAVPPFDIQIDIMKRLPIESLLKFRSVSKPWKSIIQSSGFIDGYNNHHTHHCNHQKLLMGSCSENYIDKYDDDSSFPKHKSNVPLPKLVASCRCSYIIGYSQGLFGFYNDDARVAVIWNPSIRKSVDVTIPPQHPFTVIGFGVRNATDPIIVMINDACDPISLHVEVFTLSSRVWRSLSSTKCLPLISLYLTKKVVTIDNFIYWLAFNKDFYTLILSFDMIREEFKPIHLPPILAQTPHPNLKFSKLRESLVVLQAIDYREDENPFKHDNVWMSEDGVQNSFKKLYTINRPDTSRQWVCGFRNNGQPIIIRVGYDKRSLFFVYDPDLICFNDIGGILETYSSFAASYMGTLLLFDH